MGHIDADLILRYGRRSFQNLDAIEQILREAQRPLRVAEIVELDDGKLPTCSRTPETAIARDLSLAIKYQIDCRFVRVAPGLFALAEWEQESNEDGTRPD